MSKIMILFAILFPVFLLADGGVVGNGGDSVVCKAASDNRLNGVYSLDYILGLWRLEAKPQYLAEDIFADSNSHVNNFERLIPLLNETYPVLADSMRLFYSNLFSNDLSQNIVWKPASNGLIDLKDEQMIQMLPKNCLGPRQEPSLLQTVIRQDRGAQIIYNYDSNAVKALSQKPMQLSFLLFHEWLWNFTKDVSVIRDANFVFHARDWSMTTVDAQVQILKKIGLFNTIIARMTKTKLIYEGETLRISYDGQEITPKGRTFNIRMNPNEGFVRYQFLTSGQYYLGLYTNYDEEHDYSNGRPKYAMSPGDQQDERSFLKARIYKVVLKKRLSTQPPQVFVLNFIGP